MLNIFRHECCPASSWDTCGRCMYLLAFCIWPTFGAFALHVSTSEPSGPFLLKSSTAQRFGAIERVRA